MDYQAFARLYNKDRIIFVLCVEILLENGRSFIRKFTDEALEQTIEGTLKAWRVSEKIPEAVEIVRELARIKTAVLLTYIGKSGMRIDGINSDVAGVCPVCGGPLIYGEDAAAEGDSCAGWTCQDCGATGKEVYRQVFDSHQDVRLGDGRPVPSREC